MNTITRDELQSALALGEPLTLLEALPDRYYRHGHLPGARSFPHDRAKDLAATLLRDKAAKIVVYCASATCQNSHQAAQTLTDLGYRNVRVYVEGKADWQAAGLALERSATHPSRRARFTREPSNLPRRLSSFNSDRTRNTHCPRRSAETSTPLCVVIAVAPQRVFETSVPGDKFTVRKRRSIAHLMVSATVVVITLYLPQAGSKPEKYK